MPLGGLLPYNRGPGGLLGSLTGDRGGLFNLGLALLQNSGPSPYRRSTGEVIGSSLLQLQQQRQQQEDRDMQRRLLEAQIKRAERPEEQQLEVVIGPDGNPVFVPRSEAVGKSPFVERQVSQPTGFYAEYLREHPNGDVPYFEWLKGRTAATTPVPRGPFDPGPLETIIDPATGQPTLATRPDAVGQTPFIKPNISPKDVGTARQKIATVNTARQQLANVRQKFRALRDSVSAGPFGAGLLPTEAGRQFDAAVDAMRDTITGLTRVPGIGAMSDFETRLSQAKMPSRNNFESVTAQQIQQLEDLLSGIESGYVDLLGDSQQTTSKQDAAAGPQGGVRRYNPATGRIENAAAD